MSNRQSGFVRAGMRRAGSAPASGITLITSTGGSVTITNPAGPTVNIEVAAAGITRLTGDVTAGPGSGSQVATIAAGAVTLAKMANLADQTVIGNGSGAAAAPAALALTTANGIVATAGALINTLMIGVTGGQTIFGDTTTTGNLTLRPNKADTTTGRVIALGAGITVPLGSAAAPGLQVGPAGYGIFQTGNYVGLVSGGAGSFLIHNNGRTVSSNGIWVDFAETTVVKGLSSVATMAGDSGFALGSGSVTTTTSLSGDTNQNVFVGTGLATTATNGFFYVPSCAGTPTGVPATTGNTIPLIIDRTNHKLYMYIGGWLGGTLPGAFT